MVPTHFFKYRLVWNSVNGYSFAALIPNNFVIHFYGIKSISNDMGGIQYGRGSDVLS